MIKKVFVKALRILLTNSNYDLEKPKIKNKALAFKTEKNKEPFIVCMGLAFKPDIDDLRESPALYVTENLQNEKFNVLAVEPNLNSTSERVLVETSDALNQADIIVFLVSHSDFKSLKIDKTKQVLDFCGVLNKI